jgi:two-component system cell cycle sensor histidine kinase/response regulator CckA
MTTAISAGTADALLMGIMGIQASATITTGRILVVDDDPGARDLIVSSLRADGHDVDASGNAFEALRLLGRQCYDLIVSDLMMPEVDGPSLYSAVASRWPSNPPHFVFMSGLANTSAFDGFLKVVHAPLLPKPFKVAALRRAIKRILQPRS